MFTSEFLAGLAGVLGVISGLLAIVLAVMNHNREGVQIKLRKLEKFCETVYSDYFINTNVVILGPRSAGKTSLATAWTAIWEDIATVDPTPIHFIKYEFTYPNYLEEWFYDTDIDMYRSGRWRARAVIWDFIGEERSLNEALKTIETLSDYIIILVMSAEAEKFELNKTYFNTNFLKRTQKAIHNAKASATDCFVVFNKADLIKERAKRSDDDLKSLMAEHEGPVTNIKSQFGEVRFLLTSADTGEGVGSLLRRISELLVNSEGLPLQ